MHNRLTFNWSITSRIINVYSDPVIFLSWRASQCIEYLNNYHIVISTSKDITINKNILNVIVNIARVEQIVRENSWNNDEVEIISTINNTRQPRNQWPTNTTILPSISSFLGDNDIRNTLVSIFLEACYD